MRKRSNFYVRAYTKTVRGAGQRWLGYERVRFQELVSRSVFGHLTVIDTEEVPDTAIIDKGALGESSWRSKFAGTGADFNVDYNGYFNG